MAEMFNFATKPIAVNARRLWIDERISIPGHGPMTVPAGCWIVELGAEGGHHRMAIPDDQFREAYRPQDSAAESVWKEQKAGLFTDWPDGMDASSPQ